MSKHTSPTSSASESNLTSYPTSAELDAQVADYSYEEARAKLLEIVGNLEKGNIPLAESVALWELGEALARRCQAWLDDTKERLQLAQTATNATSTSNASIPPDPSTSSLPA